MDRLVAIVGIVLLLLAGCWPVQASTSVSYSVGGQAYGWCANYGRSSAPACATQQCTKSGGISCQQVLFCPDGWGAVAFPEGSAVGFTADCGLDNRAYAESEALAACVVASNALCWTDSSFDRNGNEQSKDAKTNFDLLWYAQSLLQLNGYTKSASDGVMGPATRDALVKFQAAIGRAPSDVIDDETIRRLLDADSGIATFATQLKRDIVDPKAGELSGYIYSAASAPNPILTFSQELMQRSDADRRLALATILSIEGDKCTLPATDATAMPDASSGIWDIDCAEGNFTLVLSQGGGTMVMSNGKPGDKSGEDENVAPDDSRSPATTTTTPAGTDQDTNAPASDTGRDLSAHHG